MLVADVFCGSLLSLNNVSYLQMVAGVYYQSDAMSSIQTAGTS